MNTLAHSNALSLGISAGMNTWKERERDRERERERKRGKERRVRVREDRCKIGECSSENGSMKITTTGRKKRKNTVDFIFFYAKLLTVSYE